MSTLDLYASAFNEPTLFTARNGVQQEDGIFCCESARILIILMMARINLIKRQFEFFFKPTVNFNYWFSSCH